MAFEIAKAGWMQRLSSVLRRWKKNWVVLYRDGNLKYFESPDSHIAEECIRLKTDCIRIENGKSITEGDTPEGRNRNCLLALQLRDKQVIFCAESPDDMSAWQIALEQARVTVQNHAATHPHYGTHPPAYAVGQPSCNCYRSVAVPDGAQVNHVVLNPDGTQTNVVYVRDRGCCHSHYGPGMGTGMLAGAAIGTMMWGPLLWW